MKLNKGQYQNNKNDYNYVENSSCQINNNKIKNLTILQNHISKQINMEQLIYNNYSSQLQQLQNKKNQLIALIQSSLQQFDKQNKQRKNQNNKLSDNNQQEQNQRQFNINKSIISSRSKSPYDNTQNNKINKQKSKSIKEKIQNKSQLLLKRSFIKQKDNTQSKDKYNLLNKSIQPNSKSKSKQSINYLTNINQYKYKDLSDQLNTLFKQLNTIIANSNKSIKFNNFSLLVQSNYVRNNQIPNNNSSVHFHNTNSITYNSPQQEQFSIKYLKQFNYLNKLPSNNSSQQSDEVLTSLMNNLHKQEQRLISNAYKYQKLQIQKQVKQNLQQKTIQNMRLIFKQKKRLQTKANIKEVKSNKDIIKFGYTDKMLNLIKMNKVSKNKLNK